MRRSNEEKIKSYQIKKDKIKRNIINQKKDQMSSIKTYPDKAIFMVYIKSRNICRGLLYKSNGSFH